MQSSAEADTCRSSLKRENDEKLAAFVKEEEHSIVPYDLQKVPPPLTPTDMCLNRVFQYRFSGSGNLRFGHNPLNGCNEHDLKHWKEGRAEGVNLSAL